MLWAHMLQVKSMKSVMSVMRVRNGDDAVRRDWHVVFHWVHVNSIVMSMVTQMDAMVSFACSNQGTHTDARIHASHHQGRDRHFPQHSG